MRKQKSFQQIVWTNWISIWGVGTKRNPTTPYIRIHLRWTSNYKVKIIKFLKENRRVSLQPWYRQSFLKEKTENTYLRGKKPRIHKTTLLRIFIEKPQTAKMLATHLRKEWNSGYIKKTQTKLLQLNNKTTHDRYAVYLKLI